MVPRHTQIRSYTFSTAHTSGFIRYQVSEWDVQEYIKAAGAEEYEQTCSINRLGNTPSWCSVLDDLKLSNSPLKFSLLCALFGQVPSPCSWF